MDLAELNRFSPTLYIYVKKFTEYVKKKKIKIQLHTLEIIVLKNKNYNLQILYLPYRVTKLSRHQDFVHKKGIDLLPYMGDVFTRSRLYGI